MSTELLLTQYQQTPATSSSSFAASEMESLPPEITLMIMEAMPDMPSLYSLICASPYAASILSQSPTRCINPTYRGHYPRGTVEVPALDRHHRFSWL